jgi:hypothetical protein
MPRSALVAALLAALAPLAAAHLAGCGSKEPPPAAPANSASAENPNRRLTQSECDSLAQWLVDSCHNLGNNRSTQIDAWCSDVVRRTESDNSWATEECVKHVRYLDSVCFKSTTSIKNMMDCDTNVDRVH